MRVVANRALCSTSSAMTGPETAAATAGYHLVDLDVQSRCLVATHWLSAMRTAVVATFRTAAARIATIRGAAAGDRRRFVAHLSFVACVVATPFAVLASMLALQQHFSKLLAKPFYRAFATTDLEFDSTSD